MGELAKQNAAAAEKSAKEAEERHAKTLADHAEMMAKTSAPTPTNDEVAEFVFGGRRREELLKKAKETLRGIEKTAADAMSHWNDVPSSVPSDEEVHQATRYSHKSMGQVGPRPPHPVEQTKAIEAAPSASYQTRQTRASRTKSEE